MPDECQAIGRPSGSRWQRVTEPENRPGSSSRGRCDESSFGGFVARDPNALHCTLQRRRGAGSVAEKIYWIRVMKTVATSRVGGIGFVQCVQCVASVPAEGVSVTQTNQAIASTGRSCGAVSACGWLGRWPTPMRSAPSRGGRRASTTDRSATTWSAPASWSSSITTATVRPTEPRPPMRWAPSDTRRPASRPGPSSPPWTSSKTPAREPTIGRRPTRPSPARSCGISSPPPVCSCNSIRTVTASPTSTRPPTARASSP